MRPATKPTAVLVPYLAGWSLYRADTMQPLVWCATARDAFTVARRLGYTVRRSWVRVSG